MQFCMEVPRGTLTVSPLTLHGLTQVLGCARIATTMETQEVSKDVQHLVTTAGFDPFDGSILVAIPQAARIAKVSRRTIYNWITRNLVEVRRQPSGHLRVVASSLWKPAA